MSDFPGPFSSIKDKIKLAMLSRRPSTWDEKQDYKTIVLKRCHI